MGEWPSTRAEFDARFAAMARELRFDETTLPVVAALFAARATPRWVRLVMPLLARATLSTVPALRPALTPLLSRRVPDVLPLALRLAPSWRVLAPTLRRLPARRILAAARRAHPA